MENLQKVANGTKELKDVGKYLYGENYIPLRRFFQECNNEEERQLLRDHQLETIYHQMVVNNSVLSNIQEKLRRIEDKVDRIAKLQLDAYYGVTDNSETDMNYDGISALCEQAQKYCEAVGRELGKYGRTEM